MNKKSISSGNTDKDLDQATSYLSERYQKLIDLNTQFSHTSSFKKDEREKLVATDLFLEKDIQILTSRALEYKKLGNNYFNLTIVLMVLGTVIAFMQFFGIYTSPSSKVHWSQLLQIIAKPFTAYGLLILTAVASWRQSKANLDQAERILEKRRANRVLRLYIYLKKGEIEFSDVERILKWGTIDTTAFSNISAEGKAPMGALFSDLLSNYNGLVKNVIDKTKDKQKAEK